MRELDKYLNETLEIVDLMLNLADRFDAASEDVGCGVLYGILIDSAYKIKKLAEAEREAQKKLDKKRTGTEK
jgi:hypothetical protein